MKRVMLMTAASLVAMMGSAQANDQQLYDPAPPSDSAFVRVINGTGADANVTVGSATYQKVAKSGGVAAYQVIKEGEYTPALQVSGAATQETPLKVAAGKYYTLAIVKDAKDADGVAVKEMEDALMSNPTKSYVYFYNLTDKATAAVFSPKHKKDVVAVNSAFSAASKELGQLTVDLAVTADGKEVKQFPAVAFQRRAGVTFVLSGEADALAATMANNEVKR